MGMLISLYRYVCIKTWLAANKLSLNMAKNDYSRKHTKPGPCCLKDMNYAITRINCYLRKSNRLLRKEWTQTMHARIYGIVLGDKSSSHLEFWRDMQVVVCLCAQIFSGTPLVWHFIEYQRQEYVRLLQNANLKLNSDNTRICILLVFLKVKLPQEHLPLASLFQVPFLSIPHSVFLFWTVLTSLVHSTSLSTKFVDIHILPK